MFSHGEKVRALRDWPKYAVRKGNSYFVIGECTCGCDMIKITDGKSPLDIYMYARDLIKDYRTKRDLPSWF